MEQLSLMPVRVRVTAELRKAIYAGEYQSGDELSLTEIAARLGISRTPVREAFQELEKEGLIQLRMNRGAVVNTIDRKFIRDIFEMRRLLESKAAERAAWNGMETAGLLEKLYDLRDRLPDVGKAEYEALNQQIHTSIWRAADNHQLEKYLMEMWNGPSAAGSPEDIRAHYEHSTREHIAILQMIRDGLSDEASLAKERHYARSMENIPLLYPQEAAEPSGRSEKQRKNTPARETVL